MRRLLVVGSFVLCVLPLARAAEQTVLGNALIIRNPGSPTKQKVSASGKESPGGASLVGDPTANGAVVTITANGATPSEETYTLPVGTSATTGKPFWTGDPTRGFKYRDPRGENGPVKNAQITRSSTAFQIKVMANGKLGPIALVPPNPGSSGCVLFTIPGGDSYSVQFASGRVTNKGATLFKV